MTKRISITLAAAAAVATAAFGIPATAAAAPSVVTVTCDVWAQQFDNQFSSFAGTVHGTGPNRAAARANAESKIWGPYGSMPYIANCR